MYMQTDTKRPKLTTPDLIKLFTAVPASFVDDFFSLYDRENTGIMNDFVIDFDKLTIWLDVDKKNCLCRCSIETHQ